MAVDISKVNTLYLNDRKVKALYINGKKAFPLASTVTFANNLEAYDISGGVWGNIEEISPISAAPGNTIPAESVPARTEVSYTLSGITYTAYNTSDMWYLDSACTQKFNFDVDVITEDTVLYRKWGCESKTIDKSDAAGSMTFTLPKFVDTISGYCIGGGGNSGAKSGIKTDVSADAEVSIVGSGSNGAAASFSATKVNGGESVTLYAGASQTASYINVNGERKVTGAGGSVGGTTGNYNLQDMDPERHITNGSVNIPLYLLEYASSTRLVSGRSVIGDVSFQYYTQRDSGSALYVGLRIMLNGTVKWDRLVYSVRYKYYEDDLRWSSPDHEGSYVNNYHLGTASTYGQGGFGGFCLSTNKATVSISAQAGYRGRAYVTIS